MKTKFIMLIILVLIVTNLFSFDNIRKGFILGIGMGFSGTSFWQEYEGDDKFIVSETKQKIGLGTEFKIGYSPTNKIEIYYSSYLSWLKTYNKYSDKLTYYNGVSGLGFSYFFSSKLDNTNDWSPSIFFNCGFGYSTWGSFQDSREKIRLGNGCFLGGGYEFKAHYRINMNLFVNNPHTKENGFVITTKSTFLVITLSLLAF